MFCSLSVFARPTYVLIYIALLILPIAVGGIFFARRNLRLGRGDRRNATRLAVLMGFGSFITALLLAHHVWTAWELTLVSLLAGTCLIVAGFFWILYISFEPFVRRKWPQMLVSWTRLLSGDWRDPLVSRDVFVGIASGVLATCLWRFANYILPLWLGNAQPLPLFYLAILTPLKGIRFFVGWLFLGAGTSIIQCIVFVAVLFFMRVVLKKQTVTFVVFSVLWALVQGGGFGARFLVTNLVLSAILLIVLMRFGVLATIANFLFCFILMREPVTLDPSSWCAPVGYAVLAILAIVVLYAFRTSLGGRPIFGTPRLDE